jgi:hypothetical protein
MKLTSDLIEFIENVVKTGQSVNIENAIIDAETGSVRGIDEDRSVVLFQNENVPTFPVGSIGLSRVGIFLNRLGIVKGREGFAVNAVSVDMDGVEFVKALQMSSNDTKIDYRCANPDTIKAPKQINDTIIYRVQYNTEAVDVLQKGQAAMGTDSVSVVGSDGGVAFELQDASEDIMSHTFAPESISLGESSNGSFVHKYPVKTLLALFKQNPDGSFEIGEKGILRIAVNGLNIYVLPQV